MALRHRSSKRGSAFCLETREDDDEEKQIAEYASNGNFEEMMNQLNERGGARLNHVVICLLSCNVRHISTEKLSVSTINCVWMLFKEGLKIKRMPTALRNMTVIQPISPFLILLHAAGLEVQHLDGKLDTLEKCCRKQIRKSLRKKSRMNLYYQVAHMGLPSCIQRFLVYNIDLQNALYDYHKF